MKILVPVKRVIDYSVRVRVRPDRTGVVTEGVKTGLNPFDEIALEEALRIREAGHPVEEILAVSVGGADCQQVLRTALALGADRALLLETDKPSVPSSVARALHALVRERAPDLVLMGKQAIDDDAHQTGGLLAGLWGRPQASCVSRLEILGNGWARATREVDHGLETLEVKLPAVVTADLRLNTPRFVKMPDIMRARQKPLETVPAERYGYGEIPVEFLAFDPPPERPKGIMVPDVDALVAALKERGVL
jgi:electron transfer flavoprotein beta subunit